MVDKLAIMSKNWVYCLQIMSKILSEIKIRRHKWKKLTIMSKNRLCGLK